MTDGERLIGLWRTDRRDESSLRFGNASLKFEGNGRLIYTIHSQEKDQVMLLTYKVERGWLVTDQPSSPREDRTAYFFTDDGRLALTKGSTPIFYVKAPGEETTPQDT